MKGYFGVCRWFPSYNKQTFLNIMLCCMLKHVNFSVKIRKDVLNITGYIFHKQVGIVLVIIIDLCSSEETKHDAFFYE
jgi:hypothetical protein